VLYVDGGPVQAKIGNMQSSDGFLADDIVDMVPAEAAKHI
jgi:hypothetical protein